jgi:predicted type IV restriction endonuclease
MDREQAYTNIQNLLQEYSDKAVAIHEANEAKTRLLIINSVLKELGWDLKDFNPEEKVKGIGFADYVLKNDGVPYFVLEAKKTSYTFGSPHRKHKKFSTSLAI